MTFSRESRRRLGRSGGRRDSIGTGTRRELLQVVEPQDELASEARVGIGDVTDSPNPLVGLVEVPSELPHEVDDHKRRGSGHSLVAVNEHLPSFQSCLLNKINGFVKQAHNI